MKKITPAGKAILPMFLMISSLLFSTFVNGQMRKISREEASELRRENNQKEQAITYTVEELRAILDQSADGTVQFQFAKEKGVFTLVIAINAKEDGQSALSKGPSNETFESFEKKLFALSFYVGGRICPPPSNCLMQ